MESIVQKRFEESGEVKRRFAQSEGAKVERAARALIGALRKKRKVLLFGNGGSAADAQHIAAELVGRFLSERRGLPAIALTTNSSNLTAIANDYGYDASFSRQVEALGEKGDVAIAISTSGNSANVIAGVRRARALGLVTVGFLGRDGGKLKGLVDFALVVPSKDTQRIQETHITLGHVLCELVEDALFNKTKRS